MKLEAEMRIVVVQAGFVLGSAIASLNPRPGLEIANLFASGQLGFLT